MVRPRARDRVPSRLHLTSSAGSQAAKGSGRLRYLPEVRQQGSSGGGVQGQSGLTPSQGERGCWSWRKIDDVRKDVRSEVDGGGDGC